MKRLALVCVAAALLSACASGVYRPVGQPASTAGAATPPSQPGAGAPGAPAPSAGESSGPVLRPGPIPRTDGGPSSSTLPGGAIARLPEPPEPSRAAGATAALLEQSRDERGAGELDLAAATLERALALSPDDAALWVELAEVRLAQGEPALAQETARKALTLTGGDPALEARARRLIAR